MAGDTPRDALLAALEVRRYARIAVGVGAAVAVGVSVFFLGILAGGRTQVPLWFYPSLAFVVFATAAMLAAAVLVGRRVLRLAVHPAAVVRRAAAGGMVAGLLWLVAAAGLVAGRTTVVAVALPWAAVLSPLGLWAVYSRYKRAVPWPAALAAAAVVGLLGTLVIADIAAFDLAGLLGGTAAGFDGDAVWLFGVGAAGLVSAQTALAAIALAGDVGNRTVPAVLALPAVAGLLAWGLLGPGRLGLAVLAGWLGIAWAWTGWRLRRVEDADVPAGADPWT